MAAKVTTKKDVSLNGDDDLIESNDIPFIVSTKNSFFKLKPIAIAMTAVSLLIGIVVGISYYRTPTAVDIKPVNQPETEVLSREDEPQKTNSASSTTNNKIADTLLVANDSASAIIQAQAMPGEPISSSAPKIDMPVNNNLTKNSLANDEKFDFDTGNGLVGISKEKESLNNILSAISDRVTSTEKRNSQLVSSMIELEKSSRDKLMQREADLTRQLNATESTLNKSLVDKSIKLATAESALISLTNEVAVKNGEAKAISADLQSVQSSLTKIVNEKNSEISTLLGSVDSLNKSTAEKDREIDTLGKSLKQSNSSKNRIESEKTHLIEENEVLRLDNGNLNISLVKLSRKGRANGNPELELLGDETTAALPEKKNNVEGIISDASNEKKSIEPNSAVDTAANDSLAIDSSKAAETKAKEKAQAKIEAKEKAKEKSKAIEQKKKDDTEKKKEKEKAKKDNDNKAKAEKAKSKGLSGATILGVSSETIMILKNGNPTAIQVGSSYNGVVFKSVDTENGIITTSEGTIRVNQ